MDTHDAELRKELDATLQTRKDLGGEYDEALVDSFMEKLESRLDHVVDKRVRRYTAERRMTEAREGARRDGGTSAPGTGFVLAVLSLILAVPLSALALNAGLPGLLVAWAGIVGVNAVHSSGRLWGGNREARSKEAGDWS